MTIDFARLDREGLSSDICEHGMSADLCEGPQHYPADDPNSYWEHASTAEIMRETSFQYHQRGENCPWDCGSCPGNIAAEEAQREEEARMADPKWGLTSPVKCAKCSTRQQAVYHEGVIGVRICQGLRPRPDLPEGTFLPEVPLNLPAPTSISPALTGLAGLRAKMGAEPGPAPAPEPDWSAGMQTQTPLPAPSSGQVYDGIYTVETAEGHRTFRLRTQGPDESFAPGKQVIAYLNGADNERDYKGFGFVVKGRLRPWRSFDGNGTVVRDAVALLADPDAALVAAHCIRCHRTLTVPASVHAGYGPDCARMVGG